MAEDNINWSELGLNETIKHRGENVQERKNPILGLYTSLYSELVLKCNPRNYLSPYNPNLLKIANRIYAQVLSLKDSGDEAQLRVLRNTASKELGINFSTELLYNELCEKLNPQNYMGVHYNEALVDIANEWYNETLVNADNIITLEAIEQKLNNSPLAEFLQKKKEKEEEESRKEGRNILFFLLGLLGFIVLALVSCILAINK